MTAGLPKRVLGRLLSFALLLVLCARSIPVLAADTASHAVTIRIPEVMRLAVETGGLVFNLEEGEDFPPESFPAYFYPSSSSGEGAVVLRVNSNTFAQWAVHVKPLGDLTDGTNVIPISRLEWSVDGVNWSSLPPAGSDEFGVRLFSGSRTNGWEYYRVYYRLKLVGDEVAGPYTVQLRYSIISL